MKKMLLAVAVMMWTVGTANAADTQEVIDTLRTVQLQDVQVVSTRATKKTPMAFENVTKQQIKAVNFGQDIPYLLMLTPSVTTSSDAGTGIGYTTVRVRGTDPTRVNITSNGIPINDSESSNVFWVNMGDFASSLESMQVQRGVGTSTNGAGAFGASINLQTENIGTKPSVGIDLSAGSYGTHKETFRFGTGLLHDHWAFQGRLSNIGSDGYIDRASVSLNSYMLQGGYFSDNTVVKFITFNGIEQTYHAWNYPSKWEMTQYGRRYNSCGAYYDENGTLRYYDDQTDNYHQQHYQLFWNQIVNNNWNFNLALHYTKGEGYYNEYKSEATLAEYTLTTDWNILADLVRQKKMDNDFYGAVASVNYKDNKERLTATLGSGWNKYIGRHFGLVTWTGKPFKYATDASQSSYKDYNVSQYTQDVDHRYYNNKTHKYDFNVYGKVNYTFMPGLNAYIDLQYRHVGIYMDGPSDDFDDNGQVVFQQHYTYDFFNPKAGLYYQINPYHSIYASYAVANKEPTRNDFEENLGKKMNSEHLQDWELGYKYSSRTFSAGINLYYMNYRDQFVLTGQLNDIGEPLSANAGKSYRMGIELQAGWKPLQWLRWDANATFSRNRTKDWTVELVDGTTANLGDTPTSFSPSTIFNNVFTFDYKGFSAKIMSQYVSKQYMSNTGFDYYLNENDTEGAPSEVSMVIDPYFVTNIDLSYTFRLKGLKSVTVGCTIYNLFSEEYENNGWTYASYKKNADGKVIAYNTNDAYESGYSAQAPINFMAHLSLNF